MADKLRLRRSGDLERVRRVRAACSLPRFGDPSLFDTEQRTMAAPVPGSLSRVFGPFGDLMAVVGCVGDSEA
jgi:hypothetical protein